MSLLWVYLFFFSSSLKVVGYWVFSMYFMILFLKFFFFSCWIGLDVGVDVIGCCFEIGVDVMYFFLQNFIGVKENFFFCFGVDGVGGLCDFQLCL